MNSIERREQKRSAHSFGNFPAYLATLYTALLLAIMAGVISETGDPGVSNFLVVVAVVAVVISSIIMLVLIYNIWEFVIAEYRKLGMKPKIDSAGRAVGFLFIPLFNLYWIFKAYGSLPAHLNQLLKMRRNNHRIPFAMGYLVATLTVLGVIPSMAIFTGIINIFILVPVFIYKLTKMSELLYEQRQEEAVSPAGNTEIPDLKNPQNLFDLFRPPYGFNVHLVISMVTLAVLSALIHLIIYNFGSHFNIRSLAFGLGFPLLASAASVIFIQLASRISRQTGVVIALFTVMTTLLFLLQQNAIVVAEKLFSSYGVVKQNMVELLVRGLIDSAFYISFLMLSAKLFGIRWWNMILAVLINGLVLFFLQPLLAMLFGAESYRMPELKSILLFLPSATLYGLGWFLGIYWHFRHAYPSLRTD